MTDQSKPAPPARFQFDELSTADLRKLIDEALAEKPGECCCPTFEDGSKGFRQRCTVHGQRTREDFARITALRAELFGRAKAPASIKGTK